MSTLTEKLNNVLTDEASQNDEVRYIRQDNSLIERTNSSRVILSHDNRQLLGD